MRSGFASYREKNGKIAFFGSPTENLLILGRAPKHTKSPQKALINHCYEDIYIFYYFNSVN
jgi:hypothetical protein